MTTSEEPMDVERTLRELETKWRAESRIEHDKIPDLRRDEASWQTLEACADELKAVREALAGAAPPAPEERRYDKRVKAAKLEDQPFIIEKEAAATPAPADDSFKALAATPSAFAPPSPERLKRFEDDAAPPVEGKQEPGACTCADSSNEHGCPIHGAFYVTMQPGAEAAPPAVNSRSQQKRIAAMKGEPVPKFAAASESTEPKKP